MIVTRSRKQAEWLKSFRAFGTSVSPLERDKHTMIEYIIKRSNNTLDESDRIKLSLMNDEELVNKAFQLNININELNKYTKPKAILKERNIFNSSLKDN